MEQALERARRVAERGVKDVGDAVSRGLQEVSDRARRAGKKPSGSSDATGHDVEDVAAAPAAFFSAEQQRAMEQLGHANILISGQTGAGKSTLINAVFRVPLAVEGIGKPV